MKIDEMEGKRLLRKISWEFIMKTSAGNKAHKAYLPKDSMA
jgi:hypothetical protein